MRTIKFILFFLLFTLLSSVSCLAQESAGAAPAAGNIIQEYMSSYSFDLLIRFLIILLISIVISYFVIYLAVKKAIIDANNLFKITKETNTLKNDNNTTIDNIIISDLSTNEKTNIEVLSKDNNGIDISDEDIKKLGELIKIQKKGIFSSGNKSDIIDLLKSMISSNETAQKVIDGYNRLLNKSLISELKSLTTSYDGVKEYLSCFIEYGIIKTEYPHDLIK